MFNSARAPSAKSNSFSVGLAARFSLNRSPARALRPTPHNPKASQIIRALSNAVASLVSILKS